MADAGRKMRDCKRTQNPPKEIVNEIKTAFIRSGSESEAIAAHPPENSRSPCAAARKTSSFMPIPENKTAVKRKTFASHRIVRRTENTTIQPPTAPSTPMLSRIPPIRSMPSRRKMSAVSAGACLTCRVRVDARSKTRALRQCDM